MGIVRMIWNIKERDPMGIKIMTCSEGQAIALYICKIFRD